LDDLNLGRSRMDNGSIIERDIDETAELELDMMTSQRLGTE